MDFHPQWTFRYINFPTRFWSNPVTLNYKRHSTAVSCNLLTCTYLYQNSEENCIFNSTTWVFVLFPRAGWQSTQSTFCFPLIPQQHNNTNVAHVAKWNETFCLHSLSVNARLLNILLLRMPVMSKMSWTVRVNQQALLEINFYFILFKLESHESKTRFLILYIYLGRRILFITQHTDLICILI